MPGYYDDAVAGIRRLIGGRGDDAARAAKVTADIDPSVVRYLDELASAEQGLVRPPLEAADLTLGSPTWRAMDKSAGAYDNLLKGRTANLRNQDPGLVRAASQGIQDARNARAAQVAADDLAAQAGKIGAGGAAAIGASYVASQMAPSAPPAAAKTAGVDSTSGTAELANESRPAPVVTPDEGAEKKFTETFKKQYTAREDKRRAHGAGSYPKQASPRDQAQALMADLNARRRKAGGEVPEAPQMMKQINDLLAQSHQQMNARSPQQAQAYSQQNPSDYHAQAQALIAQLNDMRRKAGGEVPQAQQIMAEVRRLQALGDQQRNAAQTRR